jgi:hypothetical protein
MTKLVTLSIRKPAWWVGEHYWHRVSKDIMRLLYNRFGVIPNYERQCGWQLDSFLTDKELRLLCLHVFGNTAPAMVKHLGEMVIIGDGFCPHCGSNARTEIYCGFDHDGERGYWNVLGWRCTNCEEEIYV